MPSLYKIIPMMKEAESNNRPRVSAWSGFLKGNTRSKRKEQGSWERENKLIRGVAEDGAWAAATPRLVPYPLSLVFSGGASQRVKLHPGWQICHLNTLSNSNTYWIISLKSLFQTFRGCQVQFVNKRTPKLVFRGSGWVKPELSALHIWWYLFT